MARRRHRLWSWQFGLCFLAGCCSVVPECVDQTVCDLAAKNIDVAPMTAADQQVPMPPPTVNASPYGAKAAGGTQVTRIAGAEEVPHQTGGPDKAESPLSRRLQIPSELPGASAPPIELPPLKPETQKQREEAINKLFPPLPALGPDVAPAPGPEGVPLTLTDLQRLALSNSPLIRQAAADVEAARGALRQAGLYPNPTFGYEADTVGQGNTAGQQGGFLEQTIKTMGKLKLAQAAAAMDVVNAELALRQAQNDVATRVRAGYFAVLVARENVKVARALSRFTDEVFRIQVELVKAGQAAAYEPLQLRVQAMQARANLVQARNRHTAAWKQLASALGLPGMPPTALAGRIDVPIPVYVHEDILARILTRHTDVLTARNVLRRAQYSLELARVTPVPDVTVHVALQKDFTTPPFLLTHNVGVSVPLPLWDRNQGNIAQAEANLLRASEESHRVRSDLTSRLAEAFARYENTRVLTEYYRTSILPDQVRAYRGVYERHQREAPGRDTSPPTFQDVVNAQQILATQVTAYVATLGDLWAAVVDVTSLLQTGDLFQLAEGQDVAAVPELDELPCWHPCSPLQDPRLKGADGQWPPAAPGPHEVPMPPAVNGARPPKAEGENPPAGEWRGSPPP